MSSKNVFIFRKMLLKLRESVRRSHTPAYSPCHAGSPGVIERISIRSPYRKITM